MILLLDEMLDTPDQKVASALNLWQDETSLAFRSLRTEAPGMKDPDIPGYCQSQGIMALVSANLRDFGAKLALYEALLDAGVSVVVIRPQGKNSLTPMSQLSIISRHLRPLARHLMDAGGRCLLLRLNESGVVMRTLEELRQEIRGSRMLP